MKRFLRNIKNRSKNGFTLVELIVVIAIVAILTAVSIAGYYGFLAYSNQSAADQEATQFKTAIMSRMSLSYKGKTSSISSTVGVSNSKGIRIYSEVGDDHPEVGSLTLLGEAFTYVEAPSAFNKGGFNVEYDGIVICDGSKTDEKKPAIYTPKILEENNDGNITYYITEVTYQSKNGYESKVEFADSTGSYELEISSVNSMLAPSSIQVVGGLKETYYANEVIDTSNIKALVTFEDGSSAVVGSESLDIQVVNSETPLSAHKSVAVKKAANTMITGTNRKVVVTYKNSRNQSISNTSDSGAVFNGATELAVDTQEVILTKPANILESERVKNIDPSKESGFFRDPDDKDFDYYFVGTANEFRFEPKVTVIKNGKSINVVPNFSEVNHILYEVNGEEETLLDNSLNDKFTYVDDNKAKIKFFGTLNGYYKLVTTIYGKSFDTYLRILPGYNAYDAKDLKKFDNQNPLNGSNAGNANMHSLYNFQYASPYMIATVENNEVSLSNIQDENYGNAFSGENPVDVAHDGIILQGNIKLTANMFDRHVYNSKGKFVSTQLDELGRFDCHLNGHTNAAKDIHMNLFRRSVDRFQHYVFEGNYFTIDASRLPLKNYDKIASNPTKFSQIGLFDFGYNYNKEWKLSAETSNDYKINENGTDAIKTAEFNRVNIIGNSPKSDNDYHQGGLKLINNDSLTKLYSKYVNTRSGYMSYEFNHNCGGADISYSKGYDSWNTIFDIIGSGLTSYNVRALYSSTMEKYVLKDDATKGAQYTSDLNLLKNFLSKSLNGNDIYNAIASSESTKAETFYRLLDGGTRIDHCEFKNCGGPVILQQLNAGDTSWAYIPTVDITNSTLESVVNGSEAWFITMKATDKANTVKEVFRSLPSSKYTALNEQNYFNFVTLLMGNPSYDASKAPLKAINSDISANLVPNYAYVTEEVKAINSFTKDIYENAKIKSYGHQVKGYDFPASVMSHLPANYAELTDEQKAEAGLAAIGAEWLMPTNPTSLGSDGIKSVEAVCYTSIDHVKYVNIDHTTYSTIATHGFDFITKGKQSVAFNGQTPYIVTDLNTPVEIGADGYYPTAQFAPDMAANSQGQITSLNYNGGIAFPYKVNGNQPTNEVFMTGEKYFGAISDFVGFGFVIGLYNK